MRYKYTDPKEDHKVTKVIFHLMLKTAVEIAHTHTQEQHLACLHVLTDIRWCMVVAQTHQNTQGMVPTAVHPLPVSVRNLAPIFQGVVVT